MESLFHTFFSLPDTLHPLTYVGMLLLLSYAGGHLANLLKAPRVIGYLFTGILLSPSVSGILHERLVWEELNAVTHIALGVIAFSIGGSLEWTQVRRLGKQILWITLIQGLGALVLATLSLSIFFFYFKCGGEFSHRFWMVCFPMALVVGAICTATAPAATLAIVHEYRAQGTLTSTLLGVVALDDALTILFYAAAVAVAQSFLNDEAPGLVRNFLGPGVSVLISLALGSAMGAVVGFMGRRVADRDAMLGITMGAILVTGGLATGFDVHPLLANMMTGFVVANFIRHHEELFAVVERIEEPIFGMFFALAGAHLDLALITSAGLLALVITG
jgi:Kef-type K+ transport system membrane component KefB